MRSGDTGGGGELSFHRSSGRTLLTEPVLSPGAARRVQGARTRALALWKTHFSAQWPSVNTTAGDLPAGAAANLQPEPQTLIPASRPHREGLICGFASVDIKEGLL